MFTFEILATRPRGGRSDLSTVQITVRAKNHNSPFVRALHKLEEASQISRKQSAHMSVLRRSLDHLSDALPQDIDVPLSEHTRESFEDFLYSVEQAIERRDTSQKAKIVEWRHLKTLLKLNNQPLGDGTSIRGCLQDYVGVFKTARLLSKRPSFEQLSVIEHDNIADLENKAKHITKKILDDLISACEKDFDEYLKICAKQHAFGRFKLDGATKRYLFDYFTRPKLNRYFKPLRQSEILRAAFVFLREKDEAKLPMGGEDSRLNFPAGKDLKILKAYDHYRFGSGFKPWFYCQYRLPNCTLLICYLLLLAKTGWNISSVGSLNINDFKKTPNGSFEIQAPKHRTGDQTPKYVVSKADTYLKICVELLLWNHSQMVKHSIVNEMETSIWLGWQREYDQPLYPLDVERLYQFFLRHNLPPLSPSDIRPIKSSFIFLKNHDLELIRVTLGHSNLETTNLYLTNNLLFSLNESRILEFQRRFENTVADQTFSEETFQLNGFRKEKVDPSLSCDQPTQESGIDKGFFEEIKSFLTSLGLTVVGTTSLVTVDSLKQAFLLKKYYSIRWRQLYDKNPEYFVKHHLNVILYINIYMRIAKERKPFVFDELTKLNSAVGISS